MGCSIPCPFKLCNLTFPTQKRLELHYKVAHIVDNDNTTFSNATPTNTKENTGNCYIVHTYTCTCSYVHIHVYIVSNILLLFKVFEKYL